MGQVGRYAIEGAEGVGAHGVVFRAIDRQLERVVALKSIKSQSNQAIDRKSLLREAKVLASLSHPNIVTLYDVVEKDEELFLVMQHIEGVPLRERLQSGSLNLPSAIEMMEKLASALAAAHDIGIIHGDLKPANIMVDKSGEPYLVDFGLAKFRQGADNLQTILETADDIPSTLAGTLPYMAPEQLNGRAIDVRSDQFSLGAVFYEMASHRRAFEGEHEGAVVSSILHSHPRSAHKLDPKVPVWLSDLISQMLEKDPNKRVGSMERVSAAFGSPMSTGQSKPWHRRLQLAWADFKSRPGLMRHGLARHGLNRPRLISSIKLVAAGAAIALVAWAAVITFDAATQPVSVRMAEGVELIHDFGKEGAVERSQALFSSILADDPYHTGAEAGMALALIREYTSMETDPATLRRATALAQSAVERDPQLALANIAAAWAAEFNSDFDRALELYDQADVLDPDHALTFEGRARTFKKQGQFDEAEKVLEAAIETHPDYRVLYDEYGEILGRRGDFNGAEEAFRKSIVVEPDNLRGYANLAQSLHLQGKTREAIRIAQQGLAIGESTDLYNNLGTYLFFQGQYEQSAIAFEKVLELEGNSHRFLAWANLADAQRFLAAQSDQSRASYRRAIQLLRPALADRPNHEGLNSRLALYWAKAGEFGTSNAALRIALRDKASQPVTYYRALVTREIMGDRDGAMIMLRRALGAGYPLIEIERDPELARLRQDKDYHAIVSNSGRE